ncbi:MAG: RING finger protein [Oscillospiraceae bacterium]
MGKYTGCQCMICQKIFEDTDDIVVCPECGTPYHRSCWHAEGHCINQTLHSVNGSWQNVQDKRRKNLGGKTCPSCGFVNMPNVERCAVCDTSLTAPKEKITDENQKIRIPLPDGQQMILDISDPCCGMNPNEPMEEETLGDVANFVKTNTLYYIPLFRRFRDTGRKVSLNFTCILFPYLYFAYRKMWALAILSGIINIICNLPALMLQMLSDFTSKRFIQAVQETYGKNLFDGLTTFLKSNETLLTNLNVPLYLIGIGVQILFCLFGNYLYYRFTLKAVNKIRKISPTQQLKKALLNSEGGTSFWNVLGCIGIYYGIVLAIYMILAIAFM